MTIDIVGRTTDAPNPAGPYSQSRRRGALVACSGQAGICIDGSVEEGFGPQLRRTFENLKATLDATGVSFADAIQVRIFLTDPRQFSEMNEIYTEYFVEPYPARTTVTVQLPSPLLVEVDLIAVASDS
ncbi:RidA family protein [Alpinimonas psychrophila]|uniref:2-iminobutanoate/2-iminopropanoate deaminase n=1 Tax=Alpinimonas psychrophila TaxID=748908 RepID=A0A7W3JTF1_9MICO|nr:RidA family protein [Alpinimonas psychrophila]MBA8828928.1 2-iminobutanoate/2-iminopropanoate deaminase [Alpinimonas psychrophila]